jgi:hypothetical protein
MNDTLNLLFLTVLSFAILIGSRLQNRKIILSNRVYTWLLSIILLYLFVSRLLFLDQLPFGLNQDEAAIGYDAWALANAGIDRNGYPFPILPMSWGSGAGGFIIYLGSLWFRMVPLTVYNLRLLNALVQLVGLLAFYLFIKRYFQKEVALLGLAFLSLSPWHIMLSRWNLDANQVFVLIMVGLLLFQIGMDQRKKRYHIFALTSFSLAMYSYGSGVIVVPLLLFLIYAHGWWRKRLTFKTLIGYTIWFTILSLPLASFYLINTLQLEPILTPWFSITRFNVLRANSVLIPFDDNFFMNVWRNLGDTLLYLTTGKSDWLWNQLPGYGVAFLFSFPLLIVGLFQQKRDPKSFGMYAWLFVSVLFSLLLYQNINRMGVLFIPMMYFQVHGLAWLMQKPRWTFETVLGLFFAASILFHIDYATFYATHIQSYFAAGYGEAIHYAQSLDASTYRLPSQNQVNGSHVIALFYIQPDPHELVATGTYLNPGAEFQYLSSFTANEKFYEFVDPLPNQTISDNIVWIVKIQFTDYFEDTAYTTKIFTNFAVIHQA